MENEIKDGPERNKGNGCLWRGCTMLTLFWLVVALGLVAVVTQCTGKQPVKIEKQR